MIILNKMRVFSELLVCSALAHDRELQYLMSQTRWIFILNDFFASIYVWNTPIPLKLACT